MVDSGFNGADTPIDGASLAATGRETVHFMVQQAGRRSRATPIRRSFVQPLDRQRQRHGGPLAVLVRHRDSRSLLLYLLVMTMASKEPWDVGRDSRVWARALGLSGSRSSLQAVSKAWRRLRELHLIETVRKGRTAVVFVKMEDGSDRPYKYPTGARAEDRYFKLPIEFWLDDWYERLSLPALAMLLVLLAEKDGVVLPIDRVPEWYGISRPTAQRGLRELQIKEILWVREVPKKAPAAPLGFTIERHHHLLAPFAAARRSPVTSTPGATTTTASSRRRARRKARTTTKRGKEVG